MDKRVLARTLAAALADGAWTVEGVAARLVRILPPALHGLAVDLAAALIRDAPSAYAPGADVLAEVLRLQPGFEMAHRYFRTRGLWPTPWLEPPEMAPIPAFTGMRLPQLATLGALASWLGVPIARLDYMCDAASRAEAHDAPCVNHYTYLLHPKASGGRRLIEAPRPLLKALQRQILHGILDHVPPHADAFGFVTGRNCIQAAQRHAGEAIVLRFDLKDFFASLGAGRIFGLFRCLGYPHAVAGALTGLCTTRTPGWRIERLAPRDREFFRRRHLPQGAPTSPALANLVAFRLDRRLSGLARRVEANYSRYADDLCFSGDRQILGTLLRAVPQIVRDEGLVLNVDKTRLMTSGGRQCVTGIVVNRHVNADRRDYDRLKAVIHACCKPGDRRLADPAFRARLLGQIDWVESLNPRRGLKLRQRLVRTLEPGRNGIRTD